MDKEESFRVASRIMLDFAGETGLSGERKPPRRYLWTDAFAVCNFLELYHSSRDESWLVLARRLVDQVHHVLGRHRADAPKTGWLSGLSDVEGALHPTLGGLRIGKQINERAPDEPIDERLEWERDGQYYHYLTKWMHALHCVSRVTGEAVYLRWGMELAQTAHRAFQFAAAPGGSLALHWKMSNDLSRPLVRSVGQHDPLDGLITYSELQSAAKGLTGDSFPDLERETTELAAMCRGRDFITNDALGIGGLLFDAYRADQLIVKGDFRELRLFQQVVHESLVSLEDLGGAFLDQKPRYRLAFRELGLSIGLRGVERLARLVDEYPELHGPELLSWLQPRLEGLLWFVRLSEKIENFWMGERKKETEHWKAHQDINMVMLATSLVPEQFLTAR